MTEPVKPFATIDDQIDVLVSRGLVLERDVAARWLRNVGYYRLSGYWYPYRALGRMDAPRRLDTFDSRVGFDDIVRLYEFDRKLRTLIHDGIERVEVALRSHVNYRIGAAGPLAYQDATFFRPSFPHADWMSTVHKRIDRARRHSEPIRHHEAKYAGSLPIWVLTEVLDFADVSRLYEGLPGRDQWTIAGQLGIAVDDSGLSKSQRSKARKMHPLVRWMEQLTVLRNTSAHHSRVWNRSFVPAPTNALRTIEDLRTLPTGQSEKLYGALTLMGYLLSVISPGSSWMAKVRSLVEQTFIPLPGRVVAEMGFPDDWETVRLWSV